jgi:hypothetical protein
MPRVCGGSTVGYHCSKLDFGLWFRRRCRLKSGNFKWAAGFQRQLFLPVVAKFIDSDSLVSSLYEGVLVGTRCGFQPEPSRPSFAPPVRSFGDLSVVITF